MSTGKGAKVILTNASDGGSITIYMSSSGLVKIGVLTYNSPAQAFAHLGETLRDLEVYVDKQGKTQGRKSPPGVSKDELDRVVRLRRTALKRGETDWYRGVLQPRSDASAPAKASRHSCPWLRTGAAVRSG